MTNKEWLNGLSDEELAQLFVQKRTFMCIGCFYQCIEKELPCEEDCNTGHVKWLQSEREVKEK